jgi:hypothetical protein
MLTWMMFVYAVNTSQPLHSPEFAYFTQQACQMDSKAIVQLGVNYAICRPVENDKVVSPK